MTREIIRAVVAAAALLAVVGAVYLWAPDTAPSAIARGARGDQP